MRNNFPRLLFPVFVLLFAPSCAARELAPEPRQFLYVGTSSTRGSEGLYVYEVDTRSGTLVPIQTVSNRRNPGYQAIHPNRALLYSVSSHPYLAGDNGTISAFRIDRRTGRLTLINERPARGSVHVSVDPRGRFAYVSDFGGGTLSVFGIGPDGSLTEELDVAFHEGGGPDPQRQSAPRIHSAIPSPDGAFVYASAMGLDRVKIYAIDPASGALTPAPTPFVESVAGAGPRHFAIHPKGMFAYSVEEIQYAVSAYAVDQRTGALRAIQRLSLVPAEMDTAGIYISAADIHVSSDGRFLYVSNRGPNTLSIYDIHPTAGTLTLLATEATGDHPRSFGLSPAGDLLFVANRDDDTVFVFRRNRESGLLIYASEVSVPSPINVTAVVLN